jgi:hypothetical protein
MANAPATQTLLQLIWDLQLSEASIERLRKTNELKFIKETIKTKDIIKAITTFDNIKALGFIACEMEEDDVIPLIRALPRSGLVCLTMTGCKMTVRVMKELGTSLQMVNLKKLDLSGNDVGDEGCRYLAAALRDCGLEFLNLSNTKMSADGLHYLSEALVRGGTCLKLLDVGRNPGCGDGITTSLVRALPHSILETLRMDSCAISTDDFIALAHVIATSRTMSSIFFGNNHLTDSCMPALARAITECPTLTKVTIYSNDMTDAGIRILADGVRLSNHMEHLDLRLTRNMNDAGADAFIDAIHTHRTMRMILLEGTNVTAATSKALREQLLCLHTERAATTVTFCSAKMVMRLGIYSPLHLFPKELLRNLAAMLQ